MTNLRKIFLFFISNFVKLRDYLFTFSWRQIFKVIIFLIFINFFVVIFFFFLVCVKKLGLSKDDVHGHCRLEEDGQAPKRLPVDGMALSSRRNSHPQRRSHGADHGISLHDGSLVHDTSVASYLVLDMVVYSRRS